MPQFHIQVGNNGGDLEALADSLCALAQRLGMEVSTIVGRDINGYEVLMHAHPVATREEVLTGIGERISRRTP